jgi:lipoate-protein ligase A
VAEASPTSGLTAWWDEPAPGPDNMAADELLAAEAVALDRPLVRLYAWSEPTVSLGGFQRLADARASRVIAGLPLVRRPSGGGAIVHGTDLTYAVAVPRSHPWGGDPQVLYDAFHEALATELHARGLAAERHPGRDRTHGDDERLLCFDRRARGDLVVPIAGAADGHKILGSAQRRLRGAVLQHGSLLLREPPLAASAERHPGLLDLHPPASSWGLRELITAWLGHVAAAAGSFLECRTEAFVPPRAGAVAMAATRFRDSAWLARR